jgi:hypothetical protein
LNRTFTLTPGMIRISVSASVAPGQDASYNQPQVDLPHGGLLSEHDLLCPAKRLGSGFRRGAANLG